MTMSQTRSPEVLWTVLKREARAAEGTSSAARRLAQGVLAYETFATALVERLAAPLADEYLDHAATRDCLKPTFSKVETITTATNDLVAVKARDPACSRYLDAFLFFKGFFALAAHRAAHQLWLAEDRLTASWIQGRVASYCGIDLHPAAQIGCGIVFDHGTGIVVGETARIGDCTTLLHGVTLGGKAAGGDRHPKIGNRVLVGAGAVILGNIKVGDDARIGAGSIVLHDVAPGATVVGKPAEELRSKQYGNGKPSHLSADLDGQLTH
jgi:serine O-acetyltransferase